MSDNGFMLYWSYHCSSLFRKRHISFLSNIAMTLLDWGKLSRRLRSISINGACLWGRLGSIQGNTVNILWKYLYAEFTVLSFCSDQCSPFTLSRIRHYCSSSCRPHWPSSQCPQQAAGMSAPLLLSAPAQSPQELPTSEPKSLQCEWESCVGCWMRHVPITAAHTLSSDNLSILKILYLKPWIHFRFVEPQRNKVRQGFQNRSQTKFLGGI